jgi:acyl carrier protein
MPAAQIKEFILKNYLFTEETSALADDASLTATGVIDSTGVLELLLWLEETLGVTVDAEEMTPENLDSVSKIAAFFRNKRAGRTAAAEA